MILLTDLKFPLTADFSDPLRLLRALPGFPQTALRRATLHKKAVDARKRVAVCFVCSFVLETADDSRFLQQCKRYHAKPYLPYEYHPPRLSPAAAQKRILVVGAGPAGLFATDTLSGAGADVTLIERGKPVLERTRDVQRFFADGKLDPESNIQFGEGGAGAFSDGKLTTGTKSPLIETVLRGLVDCGAPEEIRYLSKPHIGTDLLPGVVATLRERIKRQGGKVRFETKLVRLMFRESTVCGAVLQTPQGIREEAFDAVILAIGHSARDTLESLFSQGVPMEQKPFAAGVRVEHPQSLIDRSRYGAFAGHPALGAADYKLVSHTPGARSAYTFCMCPGGEVVAAASEEGMVVTNGMSRYARDGQNANAALLVGVGAEDFGSDHPLAGMEWQRKIERAAFAAGGGAYRAPVQRVEDLLAHRATTRLGEVQPTYSRGVTPCDLRAVLPDPIREGICAALVQMDQSLPGFAHPDALLTGVETRSSSPVRICRDESLQSPVRRLYPCGEGAGYAGGIVSAAVDGIRCAYAVLEEEPPQ